METGAGAPSAVASTDSSRNWEDLDHNILTEILSRSTANRANFPNANQLFHHSSRVCRAWRYACWEAQVWSRPVADVLMHVPFDEVYGSTELFRSMVNGDPNHATPPEWWYESGRFRARDLVLLSILARSPEVNWASIVQLLEE